MLDPLVGCAMCVPDTKRDVRAFGPKLIHDQTYFRPDPLSHLFADRSRSSVVQIAFQTAHFQLSMVVLTRVWPDL